MRVIGFSVEQLTKNSLIVMVCGISRMKSQKREQLSVSCVLMKSLSNVSTTEFGRFSWLVVQQHSQRWVTFVVKFSIQVSETGHLFQLTVLYLKCPCFLVGTGGKERSYITVCACTCMAHILPLCSTNVTYKICPRC